eukprot:jgi/Ulvmu1/12725/UM095_0029.1
MASQEEKVNMLIKRLLLKDLRVQCRQRKLSPAGSRDELGERLKECMLETQDFALRSDDGSIMEDAYATQLFGITSTGTGNNYSRPEGQNVGNFLGDRPSSRVLAAPGGKSNFSFGDYHPPGQKPPAAEPITASEPVPVVPARAEELVPPPGVKSTSVKPSKASFLDKMTAKIAGCAPPSPKHLEVATVATTPTLSPGKENPPEAEAQAAATGNSNNNYNRPGGQNVGNFLTDRPSSRVLAPPGGGSSVRFG